MTTHNLKPKPGHVVEVAALPRCDFCGDGTPADYDFRTTFGGWANGCEAHYRIFRADPATGVGSGQRLIVSQS